MAYEHLRWPHDSNVTVVRRDAQATASSAPPHTPVAPQNVMPVSVALQSVEQPAQSPRKLVESGRKRNRPKPFVPPLEWDPSAPAGPPIEVEPSSVQASELSELPAELPAWEISTVSAFSTSHRTGLFSLLDCARLHLEHGNPRTGRNEIRRIGFRGLLRLGSCSGMPRSCGHRAPLRSTTDQAHVESNSQIRSKPVQFPSSGCLEA